MTDPIKIDEIKNDEEICHEQIAKYLIENPNFFHENPGILNQIFLPHSNGTTVSLIEYQVQTLKESDKKTNNKLSELIENAKHNDHIFNVTKSLVIDLIGAENINSALEIIASKLNKTFPIESISVLIISEKNILGTQIINEKFFRESSPNNISLLKSENSSICGAIRRDESEFIFGTSSDVLKSAAVSIKKFNHFGDEISILLAAGHHESCYYENNTGTLFLDYLCEIIIAIIKKHS